MKASPSGVNSDERFDARRVFTLDEIKQRTRKPVDAWWAVIIVDPIAVRIVWLLNRLPVGISPGFVTAMSFLVGLGAGVAFLTGHLVLGAVLFQTSFLMDCVDGKLARLAETASKLGGFGMVW